MRWVRCPGSGHSPPAGFSDGLFSLTGADPLVDFTVSFSFSLSFTFRQRNQCKRERCRILAQVTFFQRSSVPPRSPLLYQLENGGAMKLRHATKPQPLKKTPKPGEGRVPCRAHTPSSVSHSHDNPTILSKFGTFEPQNRKSFRALRAHLTLPARLIS